MRAIAIIAAGLLAGCNQTQPPSAHDTVANAPLDAGRDSTAEVRTVHDSKHEVTCWYMTGGYSGSSPAISCLPDSQITRNPNER